MSWSVEELRVELRRLGVELTAQEGRLRLKGPKGALSPELREAIEANKPALLEALAEPVPPKPGDEAMRLRRDAKERVGRRARDPIEQRAIAVVGMAGRFPGARNVGEFWSNVCAGVDSITFFTEEEQLAAGVKEEKLRDPQFVRARSVIQDPDCFDAAFFACTPREAQILDPQHRIFLECAWEALEDAGHDPSRFSGLTGVFAGCGLSGYLFQLPLPDLLETVGYLMLAISNDKDYLPTRTSFKLNLRGPSYTVQAACATSLISVHVACRSLQAHECDLALAGGSQVVVPLGTGYRYQEGSMNSPDGHCRAFDARAQGTVFGDGVGVVVLKRLQDALADGDRIYAVIRGTAVNNDGSSKVGYTAPSADGQAEVIALAQAEAEVEPRTIGLIEAHGTATRVGDPLEVAALARVMNAGTADRGYCGLSSVKTNVGHLDAAAGITGFIKATLAVQHGVMPPTVHFNEPHPDLRLEDSPFFVVRELQEWKTNGLPRRAGVNAFGIGGTNAHVVLEEAPPVAPSGPSRPWKVLPLSAKTGKALDAATARLYEHLRRHPTVELADVAYTLQVGRQAFDHRRIVVCHGVDGAVTALTQGPRLPSSVVSDRARPVAFLFPGQGAQHVGMAKELYDLEPVFREVVDACCEQLLPHLDGLDLRRVLFPAPDAVEEAERRLVETACTQPALFVIEYALARLWMSWGFEPDGMIGHSIGEYVAACLADVFTLPDALALVAARGRMMQEMAPGAMLSVPLAENELSAELGGDLSLAAVNGASLCVASGPTSAIDELEKRLTRRGQRCRRLRTSHAFHSTMMEPMLAAFTEKVREVGPQPPRRPFVSNVTGTWIRPEECTDPAYWARHLRQPVRFADGLGALLAESTRVLLEVGPGRALGLLAREHPQGTGRHVVSSLGSPRDDRADLAMLFEAVGQLWLAGVDVDWQRISAAERRRRVSLPTYPFERRRHWLGSRENAAANQRLLAQSAPRSSSTGAEDGSLRTVAPVSPATIVRRDDVGDWFYVPSWRRSSSPGLLPRAAVLDGSWLVLADERGVGAELAERLAGMGASVTRVLPGERFRRDSDGAYRLRPGENEDFAALFADLASDGRLPSRIVHLWSLGEERHAENGNGTSWNRGLYTLLSLARVLRRLPASESARIDVISSGVHEIGDRDLVDPEKLTLLAPCMIIPQEMPRMSCRNVDVVPPVDEEGRARLVEDLAAELNAAALDPVVAYRDGHRWVQSYEPLRIEAPADTPGRLRRGGVYLITGGLGSIGLLLANYLATAVGAKLVLTSRSPLPPRREWPRWLTPGENGHPIAARIRKIRALEEAGAEVLVLAADVADVDRMREVVREAEERFGTLNGVIHAAGRLDREAFGGIEELDRSACEAILRAKVDGLYALIEVLGDRPLDFCLLTSSLSAVLGGLGYTAYAAGNLFMNGFAQRQSRTTGTPWTSLLWDEWQHNGADESRAGAPTGALKLAMRPEEGVETFRRVLAVEPTSQIIVSTGDLASRVESWVKMGRLRVQPPSSNEEALAGEAEKRDTVQVLESIWRDLLGVEEIRAQDNFFDIGGSSLMAIHVTEKVASLLGVHLPFAAFLGNSLGQIANQCDEILAERARQN